MNNALLRRLFSAIQTGTAGDVEALCRRIVEEERTRGHKNVAEDLQRILDTPAKKVLGKAYEAPAGLAALPLSKRDSAPLVHVIPHEQLHHHMVLPEKVDRRFRRIEKEFAARHRLAVHGLKPSHRILLYGPPGCGKSLGAERLAWNTGLPLHKVRFDTLLSSYFGETLANLRRLFDEAAKYPCALLLDECDSLARSRTEKNDVGEVNRITNALLEFLEAYRGDGLVIAATNLDSALDSALFRRFDEVIRIPPPSASEIAKLLEATLSAIPTEKHIDWTAFASQLDGLSCSEVVQIARSAAKNCVMEGGKQVSGHYLSEAAREYTSRIQN
jgi:SpoVK/Ycf46/Vps4 family AAA+-type ATPase